MGLFGVPGVERDQTVSPELQTALLSRPEGKARVGEEEVRKATEILTRYKEGKRNLEERIVQDELWWELRHWEAIGKKRRERDGSPEPTSA